MKINFTKLIVLIGTALAATVTASASITSIKSDMCQNPECRATVVQPIVRSSTGAARTTTMTVKGQFVDLSTAVQITGTGVTVTYGTRTHGADSSIVINFNIAGNAPLGNRTVSMRYAIETNGPDTFTIRVVRGGNVSTIRRILPSGEVVNPFNMPINEPVTLRFTGTNLTNSRIAPNTIANNVTVVSCTETVCVIRLTFVAGGGLKLHLVDSGVPNQTTPNSRFWYTGEDDVGISGSSGSGTTIISPVVSSVISPTPVSIDAAPRTFMANVVRLGSTTPAFTQSGFSYYRIVSPENLCYGMSGTQSRTITVPDPIWGVTNIGANEIAAGFQAQLRSGTQILDTRPVQAGLDRGASQTFTYDRPGDSRLSVFTFLDRVGCYASPTAVGYFVDPPFTVISDSGSVLTESSESNNSRTY